MAGRARLQALKDELDHRSKDYFDVDEVDIKVNNAQTPTHLEYVCARVEDGTTTKALCKEISATIGYELTYDRLMRYLRDAFGPELAAQELDSARVRASHCMAEQALEIVDAPAYDSVTVQQARARANQRNWMAERYNPSRFGQQKGVSVNVSIGSLHLDALRSRQAKVTVASQAQLSSGGGVEMTQAQVVDAQVVSID